MTEMDKNQVKMAYEQACGDGSLTGGNNPTVTRTDGSNPTTTPKGSAAGLGKEASMWGAAGAVMIAVAAVGM